MTFARRAALLGATFASVTAAGIGAASADVPSGWAQDPHVTPIQWLLVLLICPVGIALVISLVVLLPGILRGEGLIPKPFPKQEHHEPTSGHH